MPEEKKDWELTGLVMGALVEVHRELGPGLLESAYEACVAEELRHRNIAFRQQVPITLRYRSISVAGAFVADLIIHERILVELKAVDQLAAVHTCQTLTYLKLLDLRTALLVNFNVVELRRGTRRLTLET